MIRIRIDRDDTGAITDLEARGQALLANEGIDIVCAGASALLQTALLGLEQCAGAHPVYALRKAYLRCSVPESDRQGQVGAAVAVLLESILLGLREIEKLYPDHVRIKDASSLSRERTTRKRREGSS